MIVGSLWLLIELLVLFFGISFLIQLFQRRFGAARLRAWMGGSPLESALKGIAIGFITPFCTYSAIPMLVGLRQAGVPTAGAVAFIAAAPVLDPVLFGALAVIVGLEAAVLYTAVAFVGTMTLALTAQRVGIERHLKPLPQPVQAATTPAATPAPTPSGAAPGPTELGPGGSGPGQPGPLVPDSSCTATSNDQPWSGLQAEARQAAAAAVGLLRSVGLLLVIGVGIGVVIEATVSPATVATLTGDNGTWSIPVAAALGTPLYVHTSLFVPVADSLRAAGVGVGAIVALTISGAGANLPEFVILTKLASRRLIAIFFTYVFAIALLGGLLAQTLLR